jgi:uncharacterized protein YjbJ (UPF0337 family)
MKSRSRFKTLEKLFRPKRTEHRGKNSAVCACLANNDFAFSVNHVTTAPFIACDFVLMKSSTKDKIKGGFREAKGDVKEKSGKATGNPDLRDRGTMEKAGGKVQRKIGDLKKVFDQ